MIATARPVRHTLMACVAALVCSTPLFAQERLTTIEAGGELSALQLLDSHAAFRLTSGLGARVDVNLSPRVAIESQLAWLPERSLPTSEAQGGRTVEFCAGFRAKFLSTDNVSLYVSAAPGLVHFTGTVVGGAASQPVVGSATRFALASAFGLEFYTADRWTIHIDAGTLRYANPGLRFTSTNGSSGSTVAPVVSSIERVTLGVGYRPGMLRPRRDERVEDMRRRWAIGGQLTERVEASIAPDRLSPQHTPAVGMFASYRLFEYVDLDASVDAPLRSDAGGAAIDGGRVYQALVGAKAGLRRDRFGMFLKLRGGVNAGALAFATIDAARRVNTFSRQTLGALDIGAVFERYVGRRGFLRLDAGDVRASHGSPLVLQAGREIGHGGTPSVHTIQMSAGAGVRF
jgi:hypothetical protein